MTNRRALPVLVAAGAVTLAHVVMAQRTMVEQHVIVTVVAGQRTPVQGLTLKDFIVREDGVAREVMRVSPAPPATHIALLIDDSAAAQPLVLDLRTGLTTFVRKVTSLEPAPGVMVMTFGERPEILTPFTSRRSELESTVQRIFSHSGAGAYFLDAILDATKTFQKVSAERPAVVAFTIEGAPEFSTLTRSKVNDALRAAHASLWTIELQGGVPPQSTEAHERAMVVGDVTRASGGLNYPLLNQLSIGDAFSTVADLLGSAYDVVYARPESLIPPAKRTVETRDSGQRALARTWLDQ